MHNNNYVKFNCDNDGTNCEIWRIIGVFSVDDGEGNWEQRIKLVRGSAFAEKMAWDSNYVNEWSTASLNMFLNGDYLTRQGDATTYGLKELAQSQIANAKYYLGGRGYNSTTHFGSANDIYTWERGFETISYETYCLYNDWDTTRCSSDNYCKKHPTDEICNSTRNISWVGEIALMYPSDYALVYAKGVENECFDDPHMCYFQEKTCPTCSGNYNYPETGWIYNSNIRDGQENIDSIWMLSPNSVYSVDMFIIGTLGNLGSTGGEFISYAVRPTVYLKSSINIISGDGTEQKPYILG